MIPILIVVLAVAVILAGGTASWAVFGLMMWGGLWLLFSGRRRARYDRRYARWAVVQHGPPAPAVPGPQPPAPPPVRAANRLPADAQQKVERIRRKSAALAQHQDRYPIGSKDLYVAQHTATEYLPATVGAYLEVPSWSVEQPTADGRTPLQMLHAQLDILEAKLDDIAHSVRTQRVDRLLANERFLEENFGRRDDPELTIPRR